MSRKIRAMAEETDWLRGYRAGVMDTAVSGAKVMIVLIIVLYICGILP